MNVWHGEELLSFNYGQHKLTTFDTLSLSDALSVILDNINFKFSSEATYSPLPHTQAIELPPQLQPPSFKMCSLCMETHTVCADSLFLRQEVQNHFLRHFCLEFSVDCKNYYGNNYIRGLKCFKSVFEEIIIFAKTKVFSDLG